MKAPCTQLDKWQKKIQWVKSDRFIARESINRISFRENSLFYQQRCPNHLKPTVQDFFPTYCKNSAIYFIFAVLKL